MFPGSDSMYDDDFVPRNIKILLKKINMPTNTRP